VRVAIVGAGFGGLVTAVKLKKAGIDFVILEAEDGPGGTWWRNTYPGCEVDVASILYSLSFHRRSWTRSHATQGELLEYVKDLVAQYELEPHIRYATRVDSVVWDEARGVYDVTTEAGDVEQYQVVVSAVGLLGEPNVPTWPGLEEFTGEAFHTQWWRHDLDLTGKRVALVGNGSTATQIAPEVAEVAESLTILIREPGWILPKGEKDFSASERWANANPLKYRWDRAKVVARTQWAYFGGAVHIPGSKRNQRAEARARAYIADVFKDRPDLREKVTPAYAYSGKRRILQGTYYPTLLRENVELIASPVAKVLPNAIVSESGEEREVDVIVMATGFKAAQYLSGLEVVGRKGRRLADKWRDSAYAFLGLVVDEFPNFFMLYGPNTNGGPILMHHELQADHIVEAVRRMQRRSLRSVEVDAGVVRRFNEILQKRLARTAWADSNNYMKGPDGRIVTQWGDGLISYWILHKTVLRVALKGRR
jgi:cation diffusion facilitator CzcD-associated flavoprotein CzcO